MTRESRPEIDRPNIVFILVDDQDTRTMQYMHSVENYIAKKGVTFRNAFVSDPQCCPSRITILRGQYRLNHGCRKIRACLRGFQESQLDHNTLATNLRLSGYKTSMIGKYLNGYGRVNLKIPPGWDEWMGLATANRYTNYQMYENGVLRTYDEYMTDVLSGMATRFILTTPDSTPFFLYLAPNAPHSPIVPAQRHLDTMSSLLFEHGPAFNEKDVSDKPSHIRELQIRDEDEFASSVSKQFRRTVEMLLSVDELVAAVIDALRKKGVLDNTIIVYTSDNGFLRGDHRIRSGKQLPYEESIRVPLIIRGPGFREAATSDKLVLNTDFLPTLLEAAQTSVPDFTDGRSLLPLLQISGAPDSFSRISFAIMDDSGGKGENQVRHPGYEGFRTDWYKYVEYKTGEREFYDLRSDPHELSNVYSLLSADVKEDVDNHLRSLAACSKRECYRLENIDPIAGRTIIPPRE